VSGIIQLLMILVIHVGSVIYVLHSILNWVLDQVLEKLMVFASMEIRELYQVLMYRLAAYWWPSGDRECGLGLFGVSRAVAVRKMKGEFVMGQI